MALEITGFIPRLAAVTIGTSRFDLTRWDDVIALAEVSGRKCSIEQFEIHEDDVSVLEAAIKEG